MEWMQELLGAVPAAAKYRAELEQMAVENAGLKAENAHLKTELAQYIEQWETLDGDAENAAVSGPGRIRERGRDRAHPQHEFPDRGDVPAISGETCIRRDTRGWIRV